MKQAKLLNESEFKRLSAVVDSLRHRTRNHTAIALSFYAGLRACEIAALRVGDVYDTQGKPKDTIYLSAAQTKGSESNTVLVNKLLRTQLQRYAAASPFILHNVTRPLIESAKGGHFTPQTIVNLFQRLYRLAGIAGASSHSGRRSFITNLAAKGTGVRVLASLAGHRNIQVTMRYIDASDDMKRNAVELI